VHTALPACGVGNVGCAGSADGAGAATGNATDKRPLFILLDGTWAEARKMFGRSACLDALPVLSLQPAEASQSTQYKLRRSNRDDHFCTSEVAAQCLHLAGEHAAALTLTAWLDVFTHHYLQARNQLPVAWDGAAHRRWREVEPAFNRSCTAGTCPTC